MRKKIDLLNALEVEGILMCFALSCWQMVPSDYTNHSIMMGSWILHPVENWILHSEIIRLSFWIS